MKETLGAWYWAIRPFSLSASVVPIVIGSVLASRYDAFSSVLFVLMLLASMLVQSATNLVDEYADHAQGQTPGKVLAPYKVIERGVLSAQAVRRGAMVCFGIATLIGVYLVLRTGWPLVLVCLASVAVAYGYSAGPWPLGELGLGEPLVFVFYGTGDGAVKFLRVCASHILASCLDFDSHWVFGDGDFGGEQHPRCG